MPKLSDKTQVERLISSRRKSGDSIFSRRKTQKITSSDQVSDAELQWYKDYAACLKAVGWSYRYISDTIMVQNGLVKSWFEEPDVIAKVTLVQQDIVTGAVEHLKSHAIDLIEMLLEIARNEPDAAVRLKAIESGLDRLGMAKVSRSESSVTKTEKTEHNLAEGLFDRLEGLPLKTQQEIAELSARMEELIESAKGTE